ncbi:MAG: RraA family protein [Trueperaceae bacterium]
MNRLLMYERGPRIDPELVARFRALSTPVVSDASERSHGAVGVTPVGACLTALGATTVAGPALTVRTRPGDNLVVHKALELTEPGDVLVVDARGELTNAIVGELMSLYARQRGVAAIVVDGAVRDSHELSEGVLPVFARGVSHLGPFKSGPGEIHGTVQIGGALVRDGDLVVADADGVTFVPRWRADEVAAGAEAIVAKERAIREDILAGTWDRSWIDPSLEIVEAEADCN